MAMAVFPVPGCPASKMARPAILPSLIIYVRVVISISIECVLLW
jgi:hypothetical protein